MYALLFLPLFLALKRWKKWEQFRFYERLMGPPSVYWVKQQDSVLAENLQNAKICIKCNIVWLSSCLLNHFISFRGHDEGTEWVKVASTPGWQFIAGPYMSICGLGTLLKGTRQCSEGVLAPSSSTRTPSRFAFETRTLHFSSQFFLYIKKSSKSSFNYYYNTVITP